MIHSEPDKCLVATLKSQGSSSISSKLIKSNNCHEDQQTCSNQYYERSCLSSSTSSFQTLLDPSTLPSFYTSLLCCFRCCFEYFLDFAKVADNKIEISSNQQQDKQTNFYIEKPSYRTLTFGLSSLLSISSYIITDHTILGNIPVMHITTVTTLQRQYWMNIKGRRIMLFTHIPHCVPTPHVQGISSSMSHFGNPTVATWYTTQLPCDLVISSTIINSHFSPNTDSRRTQPTTDGSGMSEKLRKKLFSNTLASPTLPWMNLIPIGK